MNEVKIQVLEDNLGRAEANSSSSMLGSQYRTLATEHSTAATSACY